MKEIQTLLKRAEKGLGVDSLNQLSMKLGYSRTNLSAIANGRRPLPIPLEIKLRKAAGETAEEIIAKYL